MSDMAILDIVAITVMQVLLKPAATYFALIAAHAYSIYASMKPVPTPIRLMPEAAKCAGNLPAIRKN